MTLIRKTIDEVVSKSIKSELIPVNYRLDTIETRLTSLETNLSKKLDKIQETMDSFAYDVKKFDEEQTVMSGHVTQHGDLIDKLHLKVFGKPAFS